MEDETVVDDVPDSDDNDNTLDENPTEVVDEDTLMKCQGDILYTFAERYELRHTDNARDEYEALKTLVSKKRTRMIISDSKDFSVYENAGNIYAGSTELKPQDFFSFTEGMIAFQNNTDYRENFLSIEPGDRLFIWQTLSLDGPDHIVGHIFKTETQQHFSFGFGYLGKAIKRNASVLQRMTSSIVRGSLYLASIKDVDTNTREGVIYTPDYVFEHRIFQQLTKPKGKFLNLIASTILTQKHVDKIKARFRKISAPFKSLLNVQLMRPNRDHYYLSYLVKPDDQMYCAYSVGGNKTKTNCAGFLQNLFGDVISCPGFLSHYRPAPEKCYQISKKASC